MGALSRGGSLFNLTKRGAILLFVLFVDFVSDKVGGGGGKELIRERG